MTRKFIQGLLLAALEVRRAPLARLRDRLKQRVCAAGVGGQRLGRYQIGDHADGLAVAEDDNAGGQGRGCHRDSPLRVGPHREGFTVP